MKHAYLILAHNEFSILHTLVGCLDDPRNDIFVHIDKKVKDIPILYAERAGLYIIEHRIDVRWGDYSMVKAEYALFEEAIEHGYYQYYHLLSGVDLPLKSQDFIHRFFEHHNDKEFIGFDMAPYVSLRMQRWHFFTRHYNRKKRDIYSVIRRLLINVQLVLGIKHNRNLTFYKGPQWVSITQGMVNHLLNHKEWVKKTFKYTSMPDESFIQTLCMMSPYKDRLYDITNCQKGCVRAIGWTAHGLIDWKAEDFDILASSPALFARKFNLCDPDLINRVVSLSNQKEYYYASWEEIVDLLKKR